MGSVRRLSALVAVLVTLLLAGCGTPGSVGSASTQPRAREAAVGTPGLRMTTRLADAAYLPAGYDAITEIAGDPSRTGVWFWDSSATQVTLFHVDGNGTMTSWPVLTGSMFQNEQALSGIAVSASGTVWFGMNTTLVELDPRTGKVDRWSIPVPGANSVAEGFEPPNLAGIEAVEALAVAPGGQVAIAMSSSTGVEIFDPNAGTFTTVTLPTSGDEPLSVAYASDGTLAVGMTDLSTGGKATGIELVSANGATRSVSVAFPGSAWTIAPYSASEFIVGSVHPSLVGTNGTVRELAVPATLVGSDSGSPMVVFSNGEVAGLTDDGLVEFPSDAATPNEAEAQSVTVSLPRPKTCPASVPSLIPLQGSPPVLPSTTTSTAPNTTTTMPSCPAPAFDIMALDGAGNLWIVSPLGTEPGVAELALPAGSVPSAETPAEAFALRVLRDAGIPPHARLTTKDVSGSLGQVFETPGVVGLIDVHRFYLVDELAGTVEGYVQAHLPKGAQWTTSTGSGTAPTSGAMGYAVSLPVSGPHDYFAELAYYFQPVGRTSDETEIRVDSQTVWEPSRSAGELAPTGGIVEVTGFSKVSIFGSSGPITVRLDNTQTRALRAVLNALPLAPSASGCHEDALLYRITFRPRAGAALSFEADGWACPPVVVVTQHGRDMAPLSDADCSLLRAVVDVLPPHEAKGTRSSVGCRT